MLFVFLFVHGLVGGLKPVGRQSEARRLAGGRPPQRARAAPTRAGSTLFEFPAKGLFLRRRPGVEVLSDLWIGVWTFLTPFLFFFFFFGNICVPFIIYSMHQI